MPSLAATATDENRYRRANVAFFARPKQKAAAGRRARAARPRAARRGEAAHAVEAHTAIPRNDQSPLEEAKGH